MKPKFGGLIIAAILTWPLLSSASAVDWLSAQNINSTDESSRTIVSLLTYSIAAEIDNKNVSLKKTKVFEVDSGKEPGKIGAQKREDETVVGESVNPIFVDGEDIYIGDSLNHRVEKFDLHGKLLQVFILSNRYSKINSITLDKDKKLYVLTGPRYIEVIIFSSTGHLLRNINLANIGVLEKTDEGIKLNKAALFDGTRNKILLDSKKNIFVTGSDLIMMSQSGKVIRRWGPNVFDFIITNNDGLIINSYSHGIEFYDNTFQLFKKIEQYKNGNFVGTEWGSLLWPEYADSLGNFYGFTGGTEHNLARYSTRKKHLDVYPVKQDDFIGASWTVDQQGNVYVAEAGLAFTVTKIEEILQANK